MRVRRIHPWSLSPREASALQILLRRRVREVPLRWDRLRRIAGCDCAVAGGTIIASVVVLDSRTCEIVETADARVDATFPYIPGLLSFREVPALLEAFEGLRRRPDAVLCDGQGRAHPRRFGLASHLGVLLGIPTVGVAKSRLIGQAKRGPGARRGACVDLLHDDEVIGRIVRTRDRVKPLFISIGHRVTLDDAVALTLGMGRGYRIPEPTRLADQRVGRLARLSPPRPADLG